MNYTYYNKWITPILSVRNEEHNTDLLVDEANNWGGDSVLVNESFLSDRDQSNQVGSLFKSGIYESSFDFFGEVERRGDCPELAKLKTWMESTFTTMFYSYFAEEDHYPDSVMSTFVDNNIEVEDIRVHLNESWLHITRDGGYHGTHKHPNHSWALIYYIDIGESSHSNGNNLFYADTSILYTEFGNFWQREDVWTLPPKNGVMIAFPASLSHSAIVYRTENDIGRYVVSGNVKVYCDKV